MHTSVSTALVTMAGFAEPVRVPIVAVCFGDQAVPPSPVDQAIEMRAIANGFSRLAYRIEQARAESEAS